MWPPDVEIGRALIETSGPIFKVVIAKVGKQGVTVKYLDLDCTIGISGGIGVECFQDKHVSPLCPTSAHNPHIHTSWPSTVLGRTMSLSDSPKEAQCKLVDRYVGANAHSLTVKLLGKDIGDGPAARCSSSQHASKQSSCTVIFTMRFHPLLRWAFNRTLSRVPIPKECGIRVLAG